ncbi:hypothetical protein B9T07_20740 [Limnospira fusiformis CCALA 023]|nr:hypothetical protein AP285_19765 [Arthrospira platensis YZ]KDR54211.1 hypothetical protein APPUASWS_029480 [Arthrospira platensis str. Paraca]
MCSIADCCTRPYIGRLIRDRNWVKLGENAIALQKTGGGNAIAPPHQNRRRECDRTTKNR